MIKLKPLAEEILLEADSQPTWGEVRGFFNDLLAKQRRAGAKEITKDVLAIAATDAVKSGFKWALGVKTAGLSILISNALNAAGVDISKDTLLKIKDVAIIAFKLGKEISNDQLKNPDDSKFKQLTSGFWDAVKLDPKVSKILDDKIEKQFLDQVILPKLQEPGNENEPIPNMNYELGKWLNDNGLKTTDIFFKGQEGDL